MIRYSTVLGVGMQYNDKRIVQLSALIRIWSDAAQVLQAFYFFRFMVEELGICSGVSW